MSGSNQQIIRVNLRKIALSAFIELTCITSGRRVANRAAGQAPQQKRGTVLGFTFDGKPPAAGIEATNGPRTGQAYAVEGSTLLDFLARHAAMVA